jgi:hypothetical protein
MEPPPSDPTPPSRPRRGVPMIAVGAGLALVAGIGIAWALLGGDDQGAAPPASEAGLVIDSSPTAEGKIDPGKPLRCFVQGQFVGELSLTECAKRNGVATDALDVGLDQTGALAAADQAGQTLTPLPPVEVQPVQPVEPAATPDAAEPAQAAPVASASACWRHGGGRWRKLGDMDFNACVQTLFAGRCEPAGGASYGRYGQQTLRRVAGRIELSDDNKSFRTLAAQNPDCSLPPVG